MSLEGAGRSTLVLWAIPIVEAGRGRVDVDGTGIGPPALSMLARLARGTMSGGRAMDGTAIDSRRL